MNRDNHDLPLEFFFAQDAEMALPWIPPLVIRADFRPFLELFVKSHEPEVEDYEITQD